eukprot:Gb_32974 [translate_table: standard]
MGTPASQLGSVINRILDLFTTFSDGLTDKIMEEKLKDVDLMVRAQAINNLLQKVASNPDFQAGRLYSIQATDKGRVCQTIEKSRMVIWMATSDGALSLEMPRVTRLQNWQCKASLRAKLVLQAWLSCRISQGLQGKIQTNLVEVQQQGLRWLPWSIFGSGRLLTKSHSQKLEEEAASIYADDN